MWFFLSCDGGQGEEGQQPAVWQLVTPPALQQVYCRPFVSAIGCMLRCSSFSCSGSAQPHMRQSEEAEGLHVHVQACHAS